MILVFVHNKLNYMKNNNIIYAVVAFIVAIGIGVGVVSLMSGNEDETPSPVQPADGSSHAVNEAVDDLPSTTSASSPSSEQKNPKVIEVEEKKIEQQAEKIKIAEPVTLQVSGLNANEDGLYSFTAKANKLPSDVTVSKFQILNGSEVVKESSNGKFKDVPYSQNNGDYLLLAFLSNGEKVEKVIGGFAYVEPVDNRMKADELEALLNKRDRDLGLGRNSKVAAKPQIVLQDIQDDNDRTVKLIDDVYGRLELGAWSSVKVVDVDYDSHKRINKIVLSINY